MDIGFKLFSPVQCYLIMEDYVTFCHLAASFTIKGRETRIKRPRK